MIRNCKFPGIVSILLILLFFMGCSGGSDDGGTDPATEETYSIGGMVNGLSGVGLVLQNNAGNNLAITGDGAFTFSTEIKDGGDYEVTVTSQPGSPTQTCTVSNGSGTVDGGDVNAVSVSCVNSYLIGGTVSGLSGSGLILQNNAGDDLAVSADGTFSFDTGIEDSESYIVTVLTNPSSPSQSCSITNGSSTVSGADVSDITISCTTDTFSVGGLVTGLNGSGLVLQNNAGNDLAISTDGAYTFSTELDDGTDYAVTVLTQPTDHLCSISNASGTLNGSDVGNVTVTCEVAYSYVLYVNVSATGNNDGSSWTNAYTSLATALSQATSGKDIWVAEGTYYPTSGTDRTASFTLVDGVAVYGGFSGTETSRADRNVSAYPTTLSGDIDGNTILDGQNSYHVVTGVDGGSLDGFTIEMGYAGISGSPPSDFDSFDGIITVESGHENDEILRIVRGVKYIAGGGMLNLQAAPTVKNCTFQNNYASKGGAVYNMVQRNYPTFSVYDSPYFENCIFKNNTATTRGGAINNDMYTDPTFISCQFLDNACDSKGGAVYSDMGCSAILVNVLFAGNTAERGSALVSDGSSIPSLLYVTIVNNTANDIGSSLYQGTYGASGQTGGELSHSNDPKIMYSLVMGNTSDASGTSISNWLDDALNIDANSIVETIDGTYTLADYFTDAANDDYEPTSTYASLGWSASRDTSNWETDITALSTRIYTDFPYNTSNTPGTGSTYYVDAAAGGSNNGSSWTNAYTDLQDALAAAHGGETINVAAGTYYPTATTDREASFVLKRGVAVYGGYPSGGGIRNVSSNTTILSGDIDKDGPDEDDSYHVIVGGKDTTLDGFTITGGYADGEWFHQRGAGVLIYGSDTETNNPTINDCIFENNDAVEGGAIACYNYGIPTISNCTFTSNTATRGGALLLRTGSDAIVTGSTFEYNSSLDRGGAVFIDYGSSPEFTGCTFDQNTSVGYGGAVYVDDNASQIVHTSPVFTSCAFTNNSTTGSYGGAIFAYNTVTFLTLETCSFGTNTASTAGGNIGLRFQVSVNFSSGAYSGVYDDGTITYNYSE